MYKSCIVPGCTTRSGTGVVMHNLPKDENRRFEWLQRAKRLDLRDWPAKRLCERLICTNHFSSLQYTSTLRERLCRAGVPDLLPLDEQDKAMEQLQVMPEPFEEVLVPALKQEPAEDEPDSLQQNSALESIEVKSEPLEEILAPDTVKPIEEILTPEISIEEQAVKPETGEDPLDCLDIDESQATGSNTILNSLKCDRCAIKYPNPDMLQWHRENCHGPDAIVRILRIKKIKYNYECVFCETVCKTLDLIIKHLRTKHRIKNMPFRCNNCDKSFIRRDYVHNHQLTCKRKKSLGATGKSEVACKMCSKTFRSAKLMQEHVSKFHAKVKERIKCIHCSESFKLLSQIKSHCTDKHPGLPVLQCEICHLEFLSYQGYYHHKKAKHDDRVYPCDFCGKEFSSFTGYNRHKKYKHETYIFPCDFCSAIFSYPTSLKNHVKIFHAGGQEPVSCNLCAATFKCQQYLNRHVQYAHSTSVVYCQHCQYQTKRKDCLKKHIQHLHLN